MCPTGSPLRTRRATRCRSSPPRKSTSSRSGSTIAIGKYTKLSPALYTAVIDEAHKNKLRVTAHIFALEDAKGLLKAGIDAFAHGIRDTDADAEVDGAVQVASERGRWFRTCRIAAWPPITAGCAAAFRTASCRRSRPPPPIVRRSPQTWAIQGRNLKKLSDAGVKIAMGTDGNTPWAPHVEMQDMVASGMTPAQVIVAATKNGADVRAARRTPERLRPARPRTCWSSTPTRSTTSPTPARSRRSISGASPSIAGPKPPMIKNCKHSPWSQPS